MAWVISNQYLTNAQMEANASMITVWLRSRGWTDNAIAGLLANMQDESTINPGIWENLTVGTGGFGLVQWTPASKYRNWAEARWPGQDPANGQHQLERIQWELENPREADQYYQTSAYPISAADFMRSTLSPQYLAYAWMYNYERPASLIKPWRKDYAARWWYFITGGQPEPPGPEPPEPGSLPLWLLFKFRKGVLKR